MGRRQKPQKLQNPKVQGQSTQHHGHKESHMKKEILAVRVIKLDTTILDTILC